ncbi:MAG TPA: error-prone DNA polymerase [Stellaceae bacterium]|nr:error-prone DNA polymerase [Stellaceae bacterium]
MPELPPNAFNRLSRTIGTGGAGPGNRKRAPASGGNGAAAGPGYAELQVTSNFSFLRGASHPGELVATAASLGHRAIAITDRNSVAGLVRAHQAAKSAGIRLVIGVRLDLRDGESLLAYPQDRAAYGRLTRLLTLGKRRAPKGECHLDYADVATHGEGQIVIVLPSENGPRDYHVTEFTARVAADFRGRAYLAAHYLYRGDDARRLARLAALADRAGLPLVALGDVLYHVPERRPLQDVLTCIREHCTIDKAGFRLAAHAERHLKPEAEMARLFRGHEDALARTLEIAGRCHFSLDELRYEYPEEPVPPESGMAGMTPQQRLAVLAWQGAEERFSAHPSPPFRGEREGPVAKRWEGEVDVGERSGIPHLTPTLSAPGGGEGDRRAIPDRIRGLIEHELALIEQLGFARYFLTVHDIVAFARSRGILCQGRGSAANSVVCYCLGITAVDPARIDVLFERFISAARGEPPDIDVDFEHERREEVIQYIYEKYGRDRAGLAATVICYRARGAIREVGKALGLSGDVVTALAGMVWGWSSEAIADQRVREAGLDPADRNLRLALDLAGELIGFPRHLSQHVGGFVITRGPLSELVPIANAAMDDRTVIEWDKDDLDALQILKIDILALGMLTCIRRAFSLIERHYGRTWDLATIPSERPEVYDMLSRADSLGVFQVESRAQMSMLPRLKPRAFYDLVIEVAIVRPGPIQGDMVHPYLRRRAGKEAVEYPSDELRQVLGKTLGVPLFQEQAMKIAIVGAGFMPEEADRLRRAMATFKRNGDIHLFREKFIAGMLGNGYAADFATRCFDQIEGFGTYGFPESHAASFALLVYVSAWIKCFHPDIFACALLNSQPMGFYAPAQIVRDAREHGVEVCPVDVNYSEWDCTLEPLEENPSAVIPGREHCSRTRNPGTPVNGAREPSVVMDSRFRGNDKMGGRMALRLGLRQVKGFSEADAERLVAARGGGYSDAQDLWRRSGLGRTALERLAAADALRSLDLDRRRGLWALKALGDAPLPLFAIPASVVVPGRCGAANPESMNADLDEAVLKGQPFDDRRHGFRVRPRGPPRNDDVGESETRAAALLPPMPLGEHVVEDYRATGLTIKRHPLAFLRAELAQGGLVRAADLATLPVGRRLAIAGLVLIRQRPGSAGGVVFITLEDETGIANLIVWPAVLERFRRAALGATMLYCRGRLQREESVIHLVAEDLQDWTPRLNTLRDRTGDDSSSAAPPPARPRLPADRGRSALVVASRDFR